MSASAKNKVLKNKEFITIDTFYDYLIANLAKLKLQWHGIESILEENDTFSISSFGRIELKVYRKDLQNAFRILSE
jgi:hypothetical protein